jgi:EAL domain-containing protein (putative c-di-GMP-specific phosphodiesterase class I)
VDKTRRAIAAAALKEQGCKFILKYQPILSVNAEPNSVPYWYEALLRVRPDDGGEDLRPAQFMPSDEPDNEALLAAIDFWVLHQISALLYVCPDSFSINFSRYLLRDPLLDDRMLALVNGHSSRLSLEVSEKYQWTSYEMERLSRLSIYVHLALDDVGAGRLEYLQSLPLSGFKIDGSLILPLLDSKKDRDIVRMLLRLSVDLGLTVVAEFVATVEHWDWLRKEADKIEGLRLFVQGHAVAEYREF